MASFYVTCPGFENHSLGLQGEESMKQGIFKGKRNGQKYVNGRYGLSKLHTCSYMPVPFETMKNIERRVLLELQFTHGYRRQHGKKEHFIIRATISERKKFVERVKELYRICSEIYL
jgi:hypothetical protein